ncbi:MAG: hypothetical protein ACRDIB_02780, partial [Ardenticatenaceae bacterium]
QQYALTEEELKRYNQGVAAELPAGSVIQVPLGTATPSPTPTVAPSLTPTPAPQYLAPIPLLPADNSTWVQFADRAPLQLVWTASGILARDEFYVVRLRALDDNDEVLWTLAHWTQHPSWRLGPEVINRINGQVRLRWDVMVMRLTSTPDAETQIGLALSHKSPTFQVIFVNSQ